MPTDYIETARKGHAIASHGNRPDYGSGPYLALMAAAVGLARRDRHDPLYSAECSAFLRSDLVALFADCIGFEGSFESNGRR